MLRKFDIPVDSQKASLALLGAGGLAAASTQPVMAQSYITDVNTAISGVESAVDNAAPVAIGLFGVCIVMFAVKKVFYS